MNWDLAAFLLLGVVILAAAVKVVVTRTLVHATVWLSLVLVGVSALFLTLGAPFLATIQLLVYVGAVITLILFTLMLVEPELAPPVPAGPRPVEDHAPPTAETQKVSASDLDAIRKTRTPAHKPAPPKAGGPA